MDEGNGEDCNAETIHIDIQDTVSATTDNKLEYTASTVGPSFADLFGDVTSMPSSNSGDGEGPAPSSDGPQSYHKNTSATGQTMETITQESQSVVVHEESTSGIVTNHVTNEAAHPVPPTIPLSHMLDLDSMDPETSQNGLLETNETMVFDKKEENIKSVIANHSDCLDINAVPSLKTDSKNSTEDEFNISPVIRTVAVETESSPVQKTHELSSKVSDNTEVKAGPDSQEDLDDGVDLSDLLKAQTNSKQDDFDDEFDFESPPKKAETQVVQPAEKIQPQNQSTSSVKQPADSELTSTSPIQINFMSKEPATDAQQSEPQSESLVADGSIKPKEPTTVPPSADADSKDEVAEVEDEWANVQTVTPTFGESETGRKDGMSTKIMSYTEALNMFLESNLTQYQDQIIRSVQRSGFKKLKHALFGPPKLHREHLEQRDQYLCMTQYSFDNNNPEHFRMLLTIYKRLTAAKFDCPRLGSHWEHIGFQGNDPSTDLRGCGMLGLLQLVYITTTPKYLSLTRDIYRLSLHETQNFPFCIMGINITRMSIQALREDCLNKEINKHGDHDFMSYMMQFYMATFYHLYSIWKSQHKTIADTGFVIRDVEAYIKKNPVRLLEDLEKKITSNTSALAAEAAQEPTLQFSKFDDD